MWGGGGAIQTEAGHLLVQADGLVGQLAGGGGGLLGHGGVLLGDVVHLAHGAADAGQTLGLFLGRAGDAAGQAVDGHDPAADALQRLAGAFDQIDATRHLGRGGRDQAANFAGRFGRALRQGAHLLGHHGEAATGVAGAGGFYPGVQGQQIGLEGDLVDQAGEAGDAGRGLGDGVDGGNRLADYLAAFLDVDASSCERFCGLAGVVGGRGHGAGDGVVRSRLAA